MAERVTSGNCTSEDFKKAYTRFESTFPGHPCYCHIRVEHIKATRKSAALRENKKKSLKSLQKRVSALRNGIGGYVLIHVCDKGDIEQNFVLSAFDEFADAGLKKLICDNSLYTDVYCRRWLSEDEQFKDFTNIIVLSVSKCRGVATVEYNTKVGSDHEIVEPQYFELITLLSRSNSEAISNPQFRNISHESLYESRSAQLKTFPSDKEDLLQPDQISNLANYIWKELRFKEYLSSFSNLAEGGSYYVGVGEATERKPSSIDGFPFSGDEKALFSELQQKLGNIRILKGIDTAFQVGDSEENLLDIKIYNIAPFQVAIEIAVRFVPGVLFYDEGPLAYTIAKSGSDCTIIKMELDEWRERLKRLVT